jgi:hypothetical protein
MFRAVITDRGDTWLGEAGVTPTHAALAVLVSPQLEAANPRALFDAFCVRLTDRRGAPQPLDECRNLWRALRDNGLVVVRGSLQMDTGRALAVAELLAEGSRPRWSDSRIGAMHTAQDATIANLQEAPLIPRRVSDFFRDTMAHLVEVASGK